ncbi:hypothetical protein [Propylenella binzhouense]|uniref:Uncharacterized protein n=1 Tax=Propylenella binzhouense TaxID=2555902 RepID=A0A964WUW8_9HYPH|nr:hypothetical protein [Propylenella binzhouense]MYZ49265.1 hypothetical protein [Propylenella binzhouense]
MAHAIAVLSGRRQRTLPEAAAVFEAAARGEGRLFVPGETPALRLNEDDGRRYAPEQLAETPDAASRLAALEAETMQEVDAFSRPQRLFVESYFRFAAERVAAEAGALASRLAWSKGLFRPEDFVFSALRPLVGVVAAEGSEARMVSGDFGFWTGGGLVLVTVTGGAAQVPRSEAIVPVVLTRSDLARGAGLFADPRFPAALRAFEAGQAVPQGPFRPRGLREGVAA